MHTLNYRISTVCRELVALIICNLTANAQIFQVLADTNTAEMLSELIHDP